MRLLPASVPFLSPRAIPPQANLYPSSDIASLTHWISSGLSTLGSIRLEGRTRDCSKLSRSPSARPLDTALIRTHFSVGPRSKFSRVFTILERASPCRERHRAGSQFTYDASETACSTAGGGRNRHCPELHQICGVKTVSAQGSAMANTLTLLSSWRRRRRRRQLE